MYQQDHLTGPARALLTFMPMQYMLDAAAENPKAALVYADDDKMPRCCAVLMGNNLFVGGHMDGRFFAELKKELFLPERRKALGVVVVFCETETIADLFRGGFERVCDNRRSLYHCIPKKTEGHFPRAVPIDRQLLASGVKNFSMITQEVLSTGIYENMEDFLCRGMGFAFVPGDSVRGFCIGEYPGGSAIAIAIEVDSLYRRQGVASELAGAFLRQASKRGLQVYWECWEKNEASVRTALSLGFSKAGDMPVLFIPLK